MEELLIGHPDDVLNKNDLNYICNCNHTLSNTHDSILSIVILNCQFESLLTKRAVLSTFVHEHNPDILDISETWLSPSITDTELLLPNYNIFRKDLSDGYGGVLLGCSKSLITQQLHIDTQAEAITCQVALKNN